MQLIKKFKILYKTMIKIKNEIIIIFIEIKILFYKKIILKNIH